MYRRRTLPNTHASPPPLWPASLYASIGLSAWAARDNSPLVLVPVAWVMLSFAFVTLWHWIFDWVVTYKKQTEKPYIPGDDVRLLEAIAGMNDNQLSCAFAAMGYEYTAPAELEPDVVDPEIADGVTKSYAVSETDRAAKRGGYLFPIRDTSEGTPDRNRRKAFEVWLGQHGLIEPAAGPKPARIKDYSETRRRITG